MGTDFSLINLQPKVPLTDDQRKLQQNNLLQPKLQDNKPNLIKFPTNDEIDERVKQALDLQKKGSVLDRGSIVNILA